MNCQRSKQLLGWLLIIALLVNVPAIAAMQGGEEQEKMGEPMKEMDRQMKMMERRGEIAPLHNGNEMLGMDIRDTTGQDVGRIENLALDMQKNKVCAVVLSVGDKLYPVPRYAFTEKPDSKICILNMKKEHLMQAPSYDEITDENLNDAGNGLLSDAAGQVRNVH